MECIIRFPSMKEEMNEEKKVQVMHLHICKYTYTCLKV
jgi:hypothetical protein